ncbi:MAG: branched-chain amino acid ABC transporter permease [Desulfomonilaceae bacterium]|nr:branched-chain amino acid ABC transporter permease [Desulfomonilaceae bacterium]
MRLSRQPFTIGLIVLLGAAATMPLWASRYWMLLCLTFCLYLSLAQMWNLLAGYCGMISLGQQSFIGLGGYTPAVLSVYYGLPLWMGVLCGGVTALVFALLTAVPLFRMRGVYFAVGTWLTAEVLAVAFSNWSFVRYGMGIVITPAYQLSLTEMYYAGLVMGIGSTALVFLILRTDLGLTLMAVRDDEAAAQTVGVDVFRSKLYGFLIAAFVTGLTAGLIYLHQVFIQPYKAFGIDWTVRLLFIVIIGGIGTIEGPIVGAVIYIVLRQVFSEYLDVSLLLMGAVAIAVMTVAPKGIVGSLQERFGFEILSSRRT